MPVAVDEQLGPYREYWIIQPLDRRWAVDGIRGYALHPLSSSAPILGPSRPEDGTAMTEGQRRAMGLINDSGQLIIDPDRE